MKTDKVNGSNDNRELYGYARCSKVSQDAEYEIKALLDKGIKRENIYIDYQSGSSEERVEFNKLLKILKPGVSSLYCTDITRICRGTRFFCEILEYIEVNHLRLVINTLDVDCRSEKLDVMVEAMLKISSVFGEMERKLKIFQINLGIQNARSKNIRLGRPPVDSIDKLPLIFLRYYPQYKNKQINKSELSRLCNLSYPCIYKYLEIIEKAN